jgi:integrase
MDNPRRTDEGQPEHRVPLSSRALEILASAQASKTSELLVFPGRSLDKHMSNMVFLMILRRMNADFTAHGFRSAFRDWASECTHFTREVCEMALAHSIKDKTEAAYRRGDLFDKRRELMEAWERFCSAGFSPNP